MQGPKQDEQDPELQAHADESRRSEEEGSDGENTAVGRTFDVDDLVSEADAGADADADANALGQPAAPATPAPNAGRSNLPSASSSAPTARSISATGSKKRPASALTPETPTPTPAKLSNKRRRGAQELDDIAAVVRTDAESRKQIAAIRAQEETRRVLELKRLELEEAAKRRAHELQMAADERSFRLMLMRMQNPAAQAPAAAPTPSFAPTDLRLPSYSNTTSGAVTDASTSSSQIPDLDLNFHAGSPSGSRSSLVHCRW
jgi:hypothetical protein